MLVETDVFLAALNAEDPVNPLALNLLSRGTTVLSPFTLLEANLLTRSGKLKILDYDDYAKNVGVLLSTFAVKILSDKPRYHSVARQFESQFKLTFFDSLHAAVAKIEGEVLATFDRVYDKLDSEGVKRISPRDL